MSDDNLQTIQILVGAAPKHRYESTMAMRVRANGISQLSGTPDVSLFIYLYKVQATIEIDHWCL